VPVEREVVIVVPGGEVNVSEADAPFAIAFPPSIRSPISDDGAVQLPSTTKPATGTPVHELFPHCVPPSAHATTR
jgi:hypothetical protein